MAATWIGMGPSPDSVVRGGLPRTVRDAVVSGHPRPVHQGYLWTSHTEWMLVGSGAVLAGVFT